MLLKRFINNNFPAFTDFVLWKLHFLIDYDHFDTERNKYNKIMQDKIHKYPDCIKACIYSYDITHEFSVEHQLEDKSLKVSHFEVDTFENPNNLNFCNIILNFDMPEIRKIIAEQQEYCFKWDKKNIAEFKQNLLKKLIEIDVGGDG